MTIQDTAIEKLRTLPDPLAQLVNDFIDLLLSQWAKLSPPSLPSSTLPTIGLASVSSSNQVAWDNAMTQIASPNPNQHAEVTSLFMAWAAEADVIEQQETLHWLTQALDADRLSDRPLFP
jgi:hypothetical protein